MKLGPTEFLYTFYVSCFVVYITAQNSYLTCAFLEDFRSSNRCFRFYVRYILSTDSSEYQILKAVP
jgi:hypothetical protein